MARTFQMQGKSSANGLLYSWQSSGSPDRSGSLYAGPGAVSNVVTYASFSSAAVVVPITIAITSPSVNSSLNVGTPTTITGTLGRPGSVSIMRGATLLGAAVVVGLNWSFSWTPVTGEIGGQTINAHAVDATNGTTADASSVFVLVLPATITFSGYKALGGLAEYPLKWDTKKTPALSGSAPNQYVLGDQYTRVPVLVPNGCGYLDVEAISTATVSGNGELGNTVDVAIDHVKQSHAMQFTTPGVKQTIRLTVPGTGTRLVELFEQNCTITGITPQTTATLIPAGPHLDGAIVMGASGSMGYYALDPGDYVGGVLVFLWSGVGQVKASGRFGASYLLGTSGYGITSYGITDAASAAVACATYITPRMTGLRRKVVWLELAAGDMRFDLSTPTQFATRLSLFVAAILAAHPTAEIKLQTPIVWGAEGTPNGLGFLMQDYRNVIPGVAAAYPLNATVVVGYAGGAIPAMTTSPGDLQDGAHCTPTAQIVKVGPYMLSVL